jgi:hypothetical protein
LSEQNQPNTPIIEYPGNSARINFLVDGIERLILLTLRILDDWDNGFLISHEMPLSTLRCSGQNRPTPLIKHATELNQDLRT